MILNNKTPDSVAADQKSNVDMSKVANGVFSSLEYAKTFFDLGVKNSVDHCVDCIKYIDLGGGDGFLARATADFLIDLDHQVECTIVDANIAYLKKAQERGLNTICDNLIELDLQKNYYDLITMRSVNHYNNFNEQNKILYSTYETLKSGCYFVSQILTAQSLDCSAISMILNLPALGRARKSDQFYIASKDTYMEMLYNAGFSECDFSGVVTTYVWDPCQSWDRFNDFEYNRALNQNNFEKIKIIETRKEVFMSSANEIIEKHLSLQPNHSAFKWNCARQVFEIEMTFPVIAAKKY